jgi:dynactin complex subunit
MAADKIPTNLVVGARVVLLNREDQGLGTVRYVGISKFAPGNWIGIEMDRAGTNIGLVFDLTKIFKFDFSIW